MCNTCGCGNGSNVRFDGHTHEHEHEHAHNEAHSHEGGKTISIERKVLEKNDEHAHWNRTFFDEKKIFVVNLMSSPGAGKTTLLTSTIKLLTAGAHHSIPVAVIEGDQETSQDADKIRSTGVQAIQINTGKGCHLDAHMVGHAAEELKLKNHTFLFIENVGNLVCPADFDLGEHVRVVVLSVTEGEDKPIKYAHMFRKADIVLLNKVDILPYLAFDMKQCLNFIRSVNPDALTIEVSATTGTGLDKWLEWLTGAQKKTHGHT